MPMLHFFKRGGVASMEYSNQGDYCELCGGSGIRILGKEGKFQQVHCSCKHNKLVTPSQPKVQHITREWLDKYIPNKSYQNEDFNVEALTASLPLAMTQRGDYLQYTQKLSAFIQAIKNGGLPNHSYYICTPKGYGKKYFAYTVMREAYKQGFRVSPIYPLWEVVRTNEEIDREKLYALFESVDMIFVTTSRHMLRDEVKVLQLLLDECELRGIVLIVLSKFGKEFIYKLDNYFDNIIAPTIKRFGAFSEMEYIFVKTGMQLKER